MNRYPDDGEVFPEFKRHCLREDRLGRIDCRSLIRALSRAGIGLGSARIVTERGAPVQVRLPLGGCARLLGNRCLTCSSCDSGMDRIAGDSVYKCLQALQAFTSVTSVHKRCRTIQPLPHCVRLHGHEHLVRSDKRCMSVYKCLQAFASVCKCSRAFTSVHERFEKNPAGRAGMGRCWLCGGGRFCLRQL